MNTNPTIGLFGTCGKSKWRDSFIAKYTELGVNFYNPLVENWTPLCAVEEAEHLASNEVILFPVTAESEGFGSLAEIGFAALNVIGKRRILIVFIDPSCDVENPTNRKLSINTRALVTAHLKKLNVSNVVVADDLSHVLSRSLFAIEQIKLWKKSVAQ